jgi:hypothetical protein
MKRLTLPSSGRSKGRFAPFGPPLMSNVRPHAMPLAPHPAASVLHSCMTTLKALSMLAAVAGLVLAVSGTVAAPANKCIVAGKVTYQQGPCPSDEVRKSATVQELNAEEKRKRAAAPSASPSKVAPATPVASNGFSCDGRKYCSQMQSCAESKFFLANCPGVKMDGDKNGIPCEQQWCGH